MALRKWEKSLDRRMGIIMKYTLGTKEVELTKNPGFYIVEMTDTNTGKVLVAYSIEDYFEAKDKFNELKRNLKKEKV